MECIMTKYLYMATCEGDDTFSVCPVLATNETEALLIARRFGSRPPGHRCIDGVFDWSYIECGLTCDCCGDVFELSALAVTRPPTQEEREELSGERVDPDYLLEFCSERCEAEFSAYIKERRSERQQKGAACSADAIADAS
jgi:hypothetical protein